MSERKIALALSGGGFRATFFHLGVVRCLRDYDLLKDVEQIVSVSGGSVLAPHMLLNWNSYSGTGKEFDKISEQLRGVAQCDLRGKCLRWLLWQRFLMGFAGNASSNAERLYDKFLFRDKTIDELNGKVSEKAPKLFILASDLSDPNVTVSFSFDGLRVHDSQGGETHIETTAVKISKAVAASAAFPIMFEPVKIDHKVAGTSNSRFPKGPMYLTDGGMRDNSGAVMLRRLSTSSTLLLVSDASRCLDLDTKTRFSSSRFSTGLRVVDILQVRVAEEVSQKVSTAGIPEIWIRLTDKLTNVNCSPQLRHEIETVRTDLEGAFPFCSLEC